MHDHLWRNQIKQNNSKGAILSLKTPVDATSTTIIKANPK